MAAAGLFSLSPLAAELGFTRVRLQAGRGKGPALQLLNLAMGCRPPVAACHDAVRGLQTRWTGNAACLERMTTAGRLFLPSSAFAGWFRDEVENALGSN